MSLWFCCIIKRIPDFLRSTWPSVSIAHSILHFYPDYHHHTILYCFTWIFLVTWIVFVSVLFSHGKLLLCCATSTRGTPNKAAENRPDFGMKRSDRFCMKLQGKKNLQQICKDTNCILLILGDRTQAKSFFQKFIVYAVALDREQENDMQDYMPTVFWFAYSSRTFPCIFQTKKISQQLQSLLLCNS